MQGKMPVFSRYSKLYRNVLSQGYLCSLSINDVWLSSTHSSALRDCSAQLLGVSEAQTPHQAACPAQDSSVHKFTWQRHGRSPRLSVQLRKSKHSAAQQPFQVFRPSLPPSQEAPPPSSPSHHAGAFHSPFLLTSASLQQTAPAGQSLVPC